MWNDLIQSTYILCHLASNIIKCVLVGMGSYAFKCALFSFEIMKNNENWTRV